MKHPITIILALLITLTATAQENIRFHNQQTDTTRINQLLQTAAQYTDNNTRILHLALQFLDKPYVAATLEDTIETLTVNLDQLDCTTLVDNILALAKTAAEHRTSWRDFTYNLRNMRYRNGQINGYPSRLHYISDWIVDNTHRGNLIEVTSHTPQAAYQIKTLDFMSTHANLYPALADSANLRRIKDIEIGYRSHRFPIIKTKNVAKVAKQNLRSGDIIALTTATPGLDVSHLAIIIYPQDIPATNPATNPHTTTTVTNTPRKGNQPYILHASSKDKKVTISAQPLTDYLAKNRNLTGIRILRLPD